MVKTKTKKAVAKKGRFWEETTQKRHSEVKLKGITSLYYAFLKEHLARNKEKIALLQLTGRIEDFLVREFIYYVYKNGNFAVANIGRKNEQKIDICMLTGDADSPKIYCMVEAKYFGNKHRLWGDATDNVTTTLKDFKRQLHPTLKEKHGGFDTRLLSKTKEIYGLVFASYVSDKTKDPGKESFYNNIKEKAAKDFKYHDLPKPYFRPIFEDVKIGVLDSVFYVTLKAGLWKRK